MRLTTTLDTTVTGSLSYKSSINRLQYTYFGGIWSAGGALITTRQQLGGAGTLTSGLAFGCVCSSVCTFTEEYSGASSGM